MAALMRPQMNLISKCLGIICDMLLHYTLLIQEQINLICHGPWYNIISTSLSFYHTSRAASIVTLKRNGSKADLASESGTNFTER